MPIYSLLFPRIIHGKRLSSCVYGSFLSFSSLLSNHQFKRSFSDLINYEPYIERLVKEGMNIKQAQDIVTTLDNAVQNRLSQEFSHFISVADYYSVSCSQIDIIFI